MKIIEIYFQSDFYRVENQSTAVMRLIYLQNISGLNIYCRD